MLERIEKPAGMIPPNPALVQCLAHIAWSDGAIVDQEVTFLRDLFQQLGVERYLQDSLLTQECPLPKEADLQAACPDPGTRRSFLKVAVELAWVDGELSDPEWEVLKQLCWLFSVKVRSWQELNQWLRPG